MVHHLMIKVKNAMKRSDIIKYLKGMNDGISSTIIKYKTIKV